MTRARATTALVLTTLAAGALPATSTAAPVKGLQDADMAFNHPQLQDEFLLRATEAKVRLTRFNPRWDGRSRVPDAGQIAQLKAFAAKAVATGSSIKDVEIAPYIPGGESFNPRRTRKGPTAGSKISRSAYRAWLDALTKELKDLPLRKFYTAINEPNWYSAIPRRGGATMYRNLHNDAYRIVKKNDPKAKVLFGELAPFARKASKNYPVGRATDPGDFVREVLGLDSKWRAKRGTKRSKFTIKADGVALHTYDFKANPSKRLKDRDKWTQANLSYAKSDLRKAARTKRISSSAVKRIYLTEFAYKTRNAPAADRLSESRAASYLKSAWKIAKKQGVRSFLWYQLRDPQNDAETWQSGLLPREGDGGRLWTTFRGLK
ncbi:MAG: hypothetical protein M0P31_11380 [Solirubrobacteraceae bacterium]|nr:hypothetical protein [Solirubrobacteraceae bacterium]